MGISAYSADSSSWTIVYDDRCPVVHKLGWLVRQWDRKGTFAFVCRHNCLPEQQELLQQLEEAPWSLMLIDKGGHRWLGPEAIPFILKNLPSGKIAAVTYTIPGTMWLTRQLYYWVSRNRRLLTCSKEENQANAGNEYQAA